jgi:uncharacterized membrane protein
MRLTYYRQSTFCAYNLCMGTFIFWGIWLLVFAFYALTDRKQRKRWEALMWIWASIFILTAETLNYFEQGYLTIV